MEESNVHIGIDIDGVLNNLDEYHIIQGSKFCYENNLPFDFHIEKYKLRSKFNWNKATERQFYKQNYLSFLTTSVYLRSAASEVIQKLYKKHNITIITARQSQDVPSYVNKTIEQITRQWLDDNLIPYNQLLFTESNKSDMLLTERITLMIEDNPEYLKQVSDIPITFLCFDANYNRIRLPANVHRIYSWYEILMYICTEGDCL